MTTRTFRLAGAALALGLTVSALSACGDSDDDSGSSGSASASGGGAKKIALLLPETKTARYETFDRPLFEAAVKAELRRLRGALHQRRPRRDQAAAAGRVRPHRGRGRARARRRRRQGRGDASSCPPRPGRAGDRVRPLHRAATDYYISFDNEMVGELQGTDLVDAMKKAGKTSGDILLVNGSPTDSNAAQFKEGAHRVIDASGCESPPSTTPRTGVRRRPRTGSRARSRSTANLAGVYAANDGAAGGAIAALKAGGVTPLPPVTGQDAELAAIQRILTGDQHMTIYKAIQPQAERAAEIAVALVDGEKIDATAENEGVPATLLDPVVVTIDNIMDTVVADGFYTVSDICTPAYAAACAKAGIR